MIHIITGIVDVAGMCFGFIGMWYFCFYPHTDEYRRRDYDRRIRESFRRND